MGYAFIPSIYKSRTQIAFKEANTRYIYNCIIQ